MTNILHPESYTEGVRLLLLASRIKDGAQSSKRVTRISHNPKQFHSILSDYNKLKKDNDRIYVSLSKRDIFKAIRVFKHRQIDAEYDRFPDQFYSNLTGQWVSCLMDKISTLKEDKLWMFDCDSQADYQDLWVELFDLQVPVHYQYATKNGVHVVVKPFNRSLISKRFSDMLSYNPLMLWSY